ncbi:MAG: hypothetical protein ACO1QR_12710 [Chthoniobacteraceae bacterium]
MSVNNSQIDVTLTAEQEASIIAAMDTLEAALPFLVSLTPDDRQRLFKLGARSEGFVAEALSAAQQYADYLPPAVGVAQLQRDLALRQTLLPIVQRARVIYTKLNDTWMLAGADAMQTATAIYRVLRAQRGEGLDVTVNTLKQRFDRSTPTTTPEPPESL